LAKFGLRVNADGKHRNILDLLSLPHINIEDLLPIWPQLAGISAVIMEQLEIDALYAGYLTRQDADIRAFQRDENLRLPIQLDYSMVGSLSNEMQQKLSHHRPTTLGAASRIAGVTPAALVALLRYVKRKDMLGVVS
jgi:tRNA uridine 5-carboxymethylaminomethyl modification enzyme